MFVNYGFALHPPERSGLSNLFWDQLVRIRPESYVGDDDYLSFVSMNKALFAGVHDAVKALGAPWSSIIGPGGLLKSVAPTQANDGLEWATYLISLPYFASTHLSDPVSLTETSVMKMCRGLPSAKPR